MRHLLTMWEMINARFHALDSWHVLWSRLDSSADERRQAAEELAPEFSKLAFGEAGPPGSLEALTKIAEKWIGQWARAELQKVEAQRSQLIESLLPHTRRAGPPNRILEKHMGFVVGEGPLRKTSGDLVPELETVAPLEVMWRMIQTDPDFQLSLTLCREEALRTSFKSAVASVALYIESSTSELDELATLREKVMHDLRWAFLLEHPVRECPEDLEARFDEALRNPEILGVLNGDFSKNDDGNKTASGPRRAALAIVAKVVNVSDATVGRRLARGSSDSRSGKARVRVSAG